MTSKVPKRTIEAAEGWIKSLATSNFYITQAECSDLGHLLRTLLDEVERQKQQEYERWELCCTLRTELDAAKARIDDYERIEESLLEQQDASSAEKTRRIRVLQAANASLNLQVTSARARIEELEALELVAN